jgi:WD40 repeat protein
MSAVAPAVPANPFLALRSFQRRDAASFFGRDADLILVQSRLFSSRCTLLFAASGVGKSSFLDAKLAPAVESQWQIVTHRSWATAAPLAGLLASIAASTKGAPAVAPGGLLAHVDRLLAAPGRSRGCLIVLDQFEEVFQHWRDSKALDEFAAEVARLVHVPGIEARVLISMREEFVGELSLFDNLIPDLFNNCYRLKNATRSEAEEIITRTALLRGVDCGDGIEPLLDDLVRSASRVAAARVSGPGAQGDESARSRIPMPFLQIVCYRLWRQQIGGAGGGAAGKRFLDKPPGPVRAELDAYCREKLQALSLPEQDLASAAFAFLMTRSGAKMAYPVDVLAQQARVDEHALLKVLEKLADENVRILRAVPGHDAKPWFELYHDLYAQFLSVWKRERDDARELKENWKWRLVVIALLVLSAATVAGLAIWRASTERDRLIADQAQEKNRALASRLDFVSGLTPDSKEFTSRGIRYAVESFARMPTPSTRATLLNALQAPVVETGRLEVGDGELAISPDGRFVASAVPDGVKLESLPGTTSIGFVERPVLVSAITFSPDSTMLAVAGWDGKIEIVSTATAQVLTSITVIEGGVISAVAFSPDGKSVLATADTESQHIAQVYVVATRAPVATVRHKARVTAFNFSPDGKYLLTGSNDTTLRLVDLIGGAQKAFPHRDAVVDVSFAPDSGSFATLIRNGVVQITGVPAGKTIPLTEPSSAVPSVLAFSPKGRFLATGQLLWDLASRTGRQLETSGSLDSIAFTPDDQVVAAVGYEGAFVVSTETGIALARLTKEPSTMVGFGSGGEWVAIKVADAAWVYRIRPAGTGGTPTDADLEARACALTTVVDANEVKSFLGTEPALGCARR